MAADEQASSKVRIAERYTRFPKITAFCRTLASMAVRITPVILTTYIAMQVLFSTDQGHDLLAAAKEDTGRAWLLLSGTFVFCFVSAISTIYLLDLDRDWDRLKVFDAMDREEEAKAAAKAAKSGKTAGDAKETASHRDGAIILLAALVNSFFYAYVAVYLFGSSAIPSLLNLLLGCASAFTLACIWLFLLRKRQAKFNIGVLALCGLLLLLFAIIPVQMGPLIGPELTLFSILLSWQLLTCVALSFLRGLGLEVWQGIVAGLAAIFAVGFTLEKAGEKVPASPIRCIGSCKQPDDPLPALGATFSDWLKGRKQRPVLLLVAAAGGGARASYWTSVVLGRLHDKEPTLVREHLFLGSGVSDGALGLTVYASLVATKKPACAKATAYVEECARTFGKGDFLSPNIASFLTVDLFKPTWASRVGRDVALERAWEESWKEIAGTATMSSSFLGLWKDRAELVPNLALNATSTRTGERVLISNLNAGSMQAPLDRGSAFNLAERIVLPLSSGINASARFPLIDPPGAVKLPEKPTDEQWEVIADGGYYDNFGAATLLDVLDRLEAGLPSVDGRKPTLAETVEVIIVQITSDPTPGMADALNRSFGEDTLDGLAQCKTVVGNSKPRPEPDPWWRPLTQTSREKMDAELKRMMASADPLEPAGIFGTLMKARSRSGARFPIELRKRARQLDGHFFHFAMDDVPAPLGWTLSNSARKRIDMLLETACHRAQMDKVVALLQRK